MIYLLLHVSNEKIIEMLVWLNKWSTKYIIKGYVRYLGYYWAGNTYARSLEWLATGGCGSCLLFGDVACLFATVDKENIYIKYV